MLRQVSITIISVLFLLLQRRRMWQIVGSSTGIWWSHTGNRRRRGWDLCINRRGQHIRAWLPCRWWRHLSYSFCWINLPFRKYWGRKATSSTLPMWCLVLSWVFVQVYLRFEDAQINLTSLKQQPQLALPNIEISKMPIILKFHKQPKSKAWESFILN